MNKRSIIASVILIVYIGVVITLLAIGLPNYLHKDAEENKPENPLITITLESGEFIKMELYPDIAPLTVENFLKYVNDGFYDNTIFHRIIAKFMMQGGGYYIDNSGLKQKAPTYEPIRGEFIENGFTNKLKHAAGVISMARTSVNDSATSQFFICTDMSKAQSDLLDGKYAAFGRVTDSASLNAVRRLASVTTSTYNDDSFGTFENFPMETVKIVSVVQTNK